MAKTSETTLRLDILRGARDAHITHRDLANSSDAERFLASLKVMECEAMMRELLAAPGEPVEG